MCIRDSIGTLPFHEERALVGGGHMVHQLGIAKPTIRHDQGRKQCHTASAECRHAPIQHALYPLQFVPARRPRAYGVWPTDGKVDRDDQLALADDHDQEDPINTREHPVSLPTPLGARESQLLTILFEDRVIAHPGPLPAAARGLTHTGNMVPQRHQYLQAQVAESLDLGSFGQRPEQTGG